MNKKTITINSDTHSQLWTLKIACKASRLDEVIKMLIKKYKEVK